MKSREISKAERMNPCSQRRRGQLIREGSGIIGPGGTGAQAWGGAGNEDPIRILYKAATGHQVPSHIQGSQETLIPAPRQECSDAQSWPTPCDTWPEPARLLCPWDSPGRSTGVGCRALLQGAFPTQGSNPSLLHRRQILYHLSHEEA